MEIEKKEAQPPVQIPQEILSSEALRGIIENFILREGTDYGREEAAFETKFKQIQKQIEKGDVIIVFDPNSETVGLLTKMEWTKISARK